MSSPAGRSRSPWYWDAPTPAYRSSWCSSADRLRRGSEILERPIASDGLRVVGAYYSLESGVVDFFDGVEQD